MAPKGPPPARASPIGCCFGFERELRPGTSATQLVHALLQLRDLARERAHVTGGGHAELRDRALHAVLEDLLELRYGVEGANAGGVGTRGDRLTGLHHGSARFFRLRGG